MKLDVELNPIHNIFNTITNGFEIPAYQRPYQWEDRHVESLFHDIQSHRNDILPTITQDSDLVIFTTQINNNLSKYLLGSIFIYATNNDQTNYIIDGQQRLTTISLIGMALKKSIEQELSLAAKENIMSQDLIDAYKNSFTKPLESIFRYPIDVFNPGIDIRLKILIQNNAINQTYRSFANGNFEIQNQHIVAQRLRDNFQSIMGLINNLNSNINLNQKQKINNICAFAGTLLHYTHLARICASTAPNEPEDHSKVIEIFGKINSRGKDLSASDLLKIDFIQNSPNNNREEISDGWSELFDNVDAPDIDKFFNAVYPALTRGFPENFRLAWSNYTQNTNPHDLRDLILNRIYPLARRINNNPGESVEINAVWAQLQTLAFNEWQAVVYEIFLSPQAIENKINIFRKLNKICFCFSLIGFRDSNRKQYISDIIWGNNANIANTRYDELVSQAIEKLKNENIYLLSQIRRRFVLTTIDRVLNGLGNGVAYDYNGVHVEHVAPQNHSNWIGNNGWTEESLLQWKHKIGNLVHLTAPINIAIGNSSWNNKKESILELAANGNININTYGLRFGINNDNFNEIEWSPDYVNRRHSHIIKTVNSWLMTQDQ